MNMLFVWISHTYPNHC